jgi:hypothetical protein
VAELRALTAEEPAAAKEQGAAPSAPPIPCPVRRGGAPTAPGSGGLGLALQGSQGRRESSTGRRKSSTGGADRPAVGANRARTRRQAASARRLRARAAGCHS